MDTLASRSNIMVLGYMTAVVALICQVKGQHQGMKLQGRQYPVEEYCDSESFTAECLENEVIVITLAKYGRHSVGRCVDRDYGNLGCESDVIMAADALCSGLRRCEFEVDDDTFVSYRPCPKDFKSHLRVSYKCVPVYTPERSCRGTTSSDPVSRDLRTITLSDLAASSRYISSDVTRLTGCGSPSYPWILKAPTTQKIELTIIDFSLNGTTAATADASRNPLETGMCLVYASIRDGSEKSSKQRQTSTICGRLQPRIRHEFTSSTNHLEIRVIQSDTASSSGMSDKRRPRFLLQYKLRGCADPPRPEGGWMRRLGDVSVVLGCNDDLTTERWHLRCERSVWLGHIGNCSAKGLSVALVVAIAFVVSCLILLVGICIITRRNTRKRRLQELEACRTYSRGETALDIQGTSPVARADPKSKYHVIKPNQSDNMYTDSGMGSNGGQGTDAYTMKIDDYMENDGKYSGYRRQSSSRSTDYYPTSEHIYEYPSPEKMSMEYSIKIPGQVSHYFDIDPTQPGQGQSQAQGHLTQASEPTKGPRDVSARGHSAPSTGTGSQIITSSEDI